METINPDKIKVLIVEDHLSVQQGYLEAFRNDPDLFVCGAAASIEEYKLKFKRYNPQVVLMDVYLPETSREVYSYNTTKSPNGLREGQKLKEEMPAVGVLFLSGLADENIISIIKDSKHSGIGFLSKGVNIDILIGGIKTVAKGDRFFINSETLYVNPKISLAHKIRNKLTPEEMTVLQGIAKGETAGAILLNLDSEKQKFNIRRVYTILNNLKKKIQKLGIKVDGKNELTDVHITHLAIALDFVELFKIEESKK